MNHREFVVTDYVQFGLNRIDRKRTGRQSEVDWNENLLGCDGLFEIVDQILVAAHYSAQHSFEIQLHQPFYLTEKQFGLLRLQFEKRKKNCTARGKRVSCGEVYVELMLWVSVKGRFKGTCVESKGNDGCGLLEVKIIDLLNIK